MANHRGTGIAMRTTVGWVARAKDDPLGLDVGWRLAVPISGWAGLFQWYPRMVSSRTGLFRPRHQPGRACPLLLRKLSVAEVLGPLHPGRVTVTHHRLGNRSPPTAAAGRRRRLFPLGLTAKGSRYLSSVSRLLCALPREALAGIWHRFRILLVAVCVDKLLVRRHFC